MDSACQPATAHLYSGMAMTTCPRCQAACTTGHCQACGCDFDPALRPTPDQAVDDHSLLEDINGSLRSEQYRIDGLLAIGGMGVVLHGRRLRDELPILVKAPRRIDEQASQRFAREARALASCDHPYIPSLIDIDISRSHRPLLIMEYLQGSNLRSVLTAGKVDGLLLERAWRSCCEALDHCHRRGVVHRDVKPDNLVIADERCMLVDFGLALVDNTQPVPDLVPRLTPSGSLLGTPPYTAPEQLRDPHAVDARADVYAVGVMLRECLELVDNADPSWTAAWREVAEACCQHDPSRRPALLDIIKRCQDGQHSAVRETITIPSQSRILLLSIIMGCLAAVVMLAFFLRQAEPRQLSGSIDPSSSDTINIELGSDGQLQLIPIGDTRLRLRGGGPWSSEAINVRGVPGETVQIELRDPDGKWQINLE